MKSAALFFVLAALSTHAANRLPQWQIADTNLAEYFRAETKRLSENCLTEIRTAEDWKQRAPEYRRQLAEMLSLSPMPERTELKATVTRRFEGDTFTVESLHFQSRPGLYATANLYVPKNLTKSAPTILYVCGHGPVITNGVSYGNKVAYQHHGVWFARNGYVCLIIDTLQLGEIQGLHHGTHREGMWWWNSRGYTPAGVETWNNMRALDYLSTRPEVDTNRFGVTGRSGGGAYSWFLTAMDERIKAAAPVAGITDLENHVVDGCVEGHCDCMFFVNTYRWDYPLLAALAAPRPLLICNSDSDGIFPLDGVVRLRDKVRRVYDLLGAGERCGLVITPGPHKDTQELQLPVMRWFNKHLKGEETLVENAAVKLFTPEQLKVFEKLPSDAINTNVHFSFVEAAKAEVPGTKEEWSKQRDGWLTTLREKSFAAWPRDAAPPQLKEGITMTGAILYGLNGSKAYELTGSRRSLLISHPKAQAVNKLVLRFGVHEDRADSGVAVATLSLPSQQEIQPKKQIQIRRRHMLLGETFDSLQVSDIAHAIRAIRASDNLSRFPIRVEAEGDMAVNALYASLFAPVDELVLTHLPSSHMNGPDYLNVLRILDIPQAVAMASERCRVELRDVKATDFDYATQVAQRFGWKDRLVIRDDAAQGQ